uniref:Uncharacterized protein n=1 Tax=Bionectria ochroleuca TaxID=29856 RepID=A0A8H7KCT7_BIOOC
MDSLFTVDPDQPYAVWATPGKPKYFGTPDPSVPPPADLEFRLLIANPAGSPHWFEGPNILHVPLTMGLITLVERLREFLPKDPAPEPSSSGSHGHHHSKLMSLIHRGSRGGNPKCPRLIHARLYLTRNPDGAVVPMDRASRRNRPNEELDYGWDFSHCFGYVDLVPRLEQDWRMVRELIVAARGQYKVFIAIKGDNA